MQSKKKKLYKIEWEAKVFGESSAYAFSKKEAREMAENGHADADFEQTTRSEDKDWEIRDVIELDD